MSGIGCFIRGTGREDIRFRWSFVLTVMVFIMQHPFASSIVVTKPMTAVSMLGGMVRMGCSRDWSNLPVDWEFAPADTNDTSFIYTNRHIAENFTSKYNIDTDNVTRYDIVIDSADSSHAGTYICTPVTEGGAGPSSASAQLIVLESDPVCTTNATASTDSLIEGDYIQAWCTVNYTGNWLPYMEWSGTTSRQFTKVISETNRLTSELITPLYSSDDGATLACNTSFNPDNFKHVRSPRPGEEVAENIPDYQYLWTFKLSVLYSPKNLIIEPKKSVYVVGDKLKCSANGNPTPTYEWMEIKTNRTISGPVLTIDSSLVSDEDHSFRCTAFNTVDGVRRQIDETVTFTVTEVASKAVSSAFTSAEVVAVIALGLAVVMSVKSRN